MSERPPSSRVRWASAYRVISSRYPPIDVFERVADPKDWETLFALEAMTNPRVRDEWGEIALVAPEDRVSGPGASWVMAAFTHVGHASRFTDGTYGVYYAARRLETAISETTFHFGRFLRATSEPLGTELEMRVLVSSQVDSRFSDIRAGYEAFHDPDDYTASQAAAKRLRAQGSNGIVYRSVRHRGGDHPCLAAFRPRAIPKPQQGPHLRYHFDGERIDRYFQIGGTRWTSVEAHLL